MKKLFSVACCLLPFGAGAVVVNPEVGQNSINTIQTAWTDAINAGETITINSPNVVGIISVDGFDIAENMFVGMSSDQGSLNGNLYVLDTVQNPFSIVSSGDVSVGAILQVLNGKTLGFKTADSNPVAFNLTVGNGLSNEGIKIGNETQTANLNITGVNKLTVNGSVIAFGNMTANVTSAQIGLINANAGTLDINALDSIEFAGLVSNSADNTSIAAGQNILSSGTVQNNDGKMTLRAENTVQIETNLENKSTGNIEVSAGTLSVGGTMTNESRNATMILNLENWVVDGGSAADFSFINAGNLEAKVTGDTYFRWGLNLSDMGVDNVFNLDTGTISFGAGATWINLFSNYLNSSNLAIRDGDIDVSAIVNGMNNDGVINPNASMDILAENVTVDIVRNDGKSLVIKAADLATGYNVVGAAASADVGNLTVTGQVIGATGSQTDLIASGVLNVAGVVNNSGNMTLNGNTVNVVSATNAGVGAKLTISSLTAPTGKVEVQGNITNAGGETLIFAKDVSIDGMITNNSGITEIRGSDTNGGPVQVGAINAAGGIVNLDALAGSAEIKNTLTVAGGTLNLGYGLTNLTVDGSVQVAGDVIANGSDDAIAGNLNVLNAGTAPFVLGANAIMVEGDVVANANDFARKVMFDSGLINISGDAVVANKGMLTLGLSANAYVKVNGQLSVTDSGVFESFANELFVGSVYTDAQFIMHGTKLTADAGNLEINGALYFDPVNDPSFPGTGLIIKDTNVFTMETASDGADVSVGAVSVGTTKSLTLKSKDEITVGGTIVNNGTVNVDAGTEFTVTGKISNTGAGFDIDAVNVNMTGLDNSGVMNVVATDDVVLANVLNSDGTVNISAATTISADAITQTGGTVNLGADNISAQNITINAGAGAKMFLDATRADVSGNVNVAGNLVQGGTVGMLNLGLDNFSANNLTLGGDFIALGDDTTYSIDNILDITGNINVASGANVVFNVENAVRGGDVVNAGDLTLNAEYGIELGGIINNSGVVNVDSGTGMFTIDNLVMNGGKLTLNGAGMNISGVIENTGATLYQDYTASLTMPGIIVAESDYQITTATLNVREINQNGKLIINTSNVGVDANINAMDLTFNAQTLSDGITTDWMNVAVGGNVSGNVDFIGIEKMTIGGDYVFNDNSSINAAILPYVSGSGMNSTDINYWASVSLNDDDTLGQITNPEDARALISVGGRFETDLNTLGTLTGTGELGNGQIGIDIFDIVDQGTAIWFLHADNGINELATKIRNLNVSFCNADGSLCFDYLDAISIKNGKDINGADEDLPAYIAVRDLNQDGTADSLYIVFDPRFGGPVEVFKIQPIVERVQPHTMGEYVAAGALDNMIAGQLVNKKFLNKTPIEVIPLIFEGTNLSTMANELYNRMEDYAMNRDGDALARFSRLFQVYELEQIVGAISLNEHTWFRNIEDRMFDEFIWNRNRNLKKAWLDFDLGMAYQNIDDRKHADGHRFSVMGGFDWQKSNTLVLGLTGHVSRTSFDSHDAIDLSYVGHENVMGDVKITVADTNIGLGGYLLKTLGEKSRLYGNLFADVHVLDIDRVQTFVDDIQGNGFSASLISEWGLMHDILNQYVVGNLYARGGYNFGFDVKEKAAGSDYMRLESDGYFILTPGYSLMAQKRIYPSAWLQIRPYASIGIEYDLIGAPDTARYKFVVADEFTRYNTEINPLWANIGGGIEVLSANGVQFGLDYRYQYNSDIQLHNIKVSGSYRF